SPGPILAPRPLNPFQPLFSFALYSTGLHGIGLCAECSDLVHHHVKIKLLATTHGNVKKVLSEIEDIVDLPYRADRCWEMLEADEANLVPAFEALVLLTGTAENAKLAWQRYVNVRP
ncbi:hypothetical protein Vretimale_16400, partial [Volvox reticuliferus]